MLLYTIKMSDLENEVAKWVILKNIVIIDL